MASETRKSEGILVTLEGTTAASNIAAGTPVALSVGDSGKSSLIFTLGKSVTGLTASEVAGQQFVGILDEDISGEQPEVTVWTDGVFKMQLASTVAPYSALAFPGTPVFANSGIVVDITSGTGHTGEVAIGTLLERPLQLAADTGTQFTGKPWVQVKINPAVFRWGSAADDITGTSQTMWGSFPKIAF